MARALTYGEGLAAPEVMDANQLLAQAEALVDQLVCYRAYPSNTPAEGWRRYAGILKREGQAYKIAQDPSFNYLPLTVPVNAPSEVPFPAPGYTYTRIVRATVWVAEHAKNLEQHIRLLTANAGAGVDPLGRGRGRGRGARGRGGGGEIPPPAAVAQPPPQGAIVPENYLDDDDDDGLEGAEEYREGVQVESDAFAFAIEQWEGLTPSEASRLEVFYRCRFGPLLADQRHKYQTQDCIRVLGQSAMAIATGGSVASNAHVQNALRCVLKRLLVMEKMQMGHNTDYINQFAAAIDSVGMPSWVTNAEKQAAATVKNRQVTHLQQLRRTDAKRPSSVSSVGKPGKKPAQPAN